MLEEGNAELAALREELVNNSKATIKAYSKIESLLKNKEPLIMLDINTYNYYTNAKLKDYYIERTFNYASVEFSHKISY